MNSAERAGATVDRLAPAVEQALSVVEGAPKLLLSERDAVLKALQDELTRTIKFVQEERIVALEHLTKERIAALNEMREILVEERKILTQDIEHLSLKVVDHAFWRAAQLLTLLFVALFVALVAAFFALKRSGPGRTTTP